VAVGVPALSTAFFELVRLGGNSPSAAKAATMITELSLAGLLGTAGQVLSVAILMVVGIAASWSFGREFVDDALPVLFAIATPRSSVAAAKFVVLAGWALLTVVSTVILTMLGGLLLGLDMDATAVQTASRVAAAGLLGAALAAPMALVSSWRRGYLPGIVALMALAVVTQLVTAMGAGLGSPMPRQRCGWAWAARTPPARCHSSSYCYRSQLRAWPSSRRSAGGGAPRRADRRPLRDLQSRRVDATVYSAHTVPGPSLVGNAAIRFWLVPLAKAAASGKSTWVASDSVRRGRELGCAASRSDMDVAADAFTLSIRLWSTGLR
jgi:ABC-2 type transport system permease protein